MKLFFLKRSFWIEKKHEILNPNNIPYYLFFFVILLIFFANTLHESYPDEFDNILGGWNILNGNPLYSKFFTHHGPVAYMIAAIVEIFSGNSFVRFRIIYSIFLFFYFVFTYWYFRKSFQFIRSRFYLLFIVFFGIGATYFWGHMLLADNTAALFLTPVVGLLILKGLYKKPLLRRDLIFISILTFLSLLSSLTYLYLCFIIYLYALYAYFSSNDLSYRRLKNYIFPFLVFSVPYFVFLIYLLVTFSIYDYFYQNFVFNQKYYIYNYPRAPGETTINPLRFAIIIAHSFLMNFSDLLIQVKDFNFYFPFNITLAVANTVFLIYLFLKRKYTLLVLSLLTLIYANGRSNPLTSAERDYQSSVYILLSLFNMCFVLYRLFDDLKNEVEFRIKAIYTIMFLVLFIYGFATFHFLGRKFIDKTFNKYMGTAPLIYDRPQIAPIMNTVLTPDEYTWIGPFEFEELFYTKAKNASQYQIFNPGEGRSERIHNGLIEDFEETKPKLIWFDKKFHILGENPEIYGKKFIKYINEHYVTLLEYRNGGKKYVSVKPIDPRTDIETKLYIRRENVKEIIQRLLDAGIIREVSAE